MNRYKALTLQNKKVIHVTLLRSYKRVQHLLWPRRQCLHSQHSAEPNKDKRARSSFHFPKLVLQILFQIQFGLSYQYEIQPQKWKRLHKFIHHYIFFPKTCYHGNHTTPSVLHSKLESIVVFRATGRWKRLYKILSGMIFKIFKFKKFCRADERKKLLFDYWFLHFFPFYRIF